MKLTKSILLQYKRILKELGTDCTIVYKGQDKCPGAFNQMGEYDEYKDILYHKKNPTEPQCSNGYLGERRVAVKCNLYDRYSVFEDKYSILGLLHDNELVLFFLPEVDLKNVDYFEIQNEKYRMRDCKIRIDNNLAELKYAIVRKEGGDNE